MPGIKRPHLEENAADGHDDLHPSRRRRLEVSQANAQIASILNDLADTVPTLRLEAARKLLTLLSTKSEEQSQLLDYALTRLIKGLCSDRKAARLGFSVALVEALRLAFDPKNKVQTKFPSLRSLVDQIVVQTRPEGKASGQERRCHLLGRRSAYQAILQSNIIQLGSEDEIRHVFDALADLAAEMQWLRSECLAVLHEFLNSSDGSQLGNQNARHLIDSWQPKGLLKTPEGVALWISVRDVFPQAKWPKGVWHHHNPLSSQDRIALSEIMLKPTFDSDDAQANLLSKKGGARQSTPSFAWSVILSHLYLEGKTSDFASFWTACVAKPMFSSSSSTERKALGLQIFTQALSSAPAALLEHVVHPNILQCILDQRAKSDRFLFEAAKVPLSQMLARAKKEPASVSHLVRQMARIVPGNVDMSTKKNIEALLSLADLDGLSEIVKNLVELCWTPGTQGTSQTDQKRRLLADMLLTTVRSRRGDSSQLFIEGSKKGPTVAPWLDSLLEDMVKLGYGAVDPTTSPPMSESSRSIFRNRLTSCLSDLLDRPLEQAVLAPSSVVAALYSQRKNLVVNLDDKTSQVLKDARKLEKAAAEKARNGQDSQATTDRAFQLLLALSMLEAYNQEPESVGILEDLISYYQSPRDDADSSTTLIELLLSFASKQASLFRKLAEQVFAAFAPDVTRDGLQSMIDVLQQKEGLSGQQELFDQHDGDAAEDDEISDEGGIDVEDDSDVEMVNGEFVGANGEKDGAADESVDSQSDGSDDDDENADDSIEEDEEAEFDRKLADALGTQGMNVDSDDDGSDMDDEQMIALDPHLTNIFKERKTGTSKKQVNKDAKENMVQFKSRVLDLLKKYVDSQYANPIALDLILPLVMLVRTTSSKAIAEKVFNGVLKPYFDACGKYKRLPQPPNQDDCFEVLKAVHAEMRFGGSKLHANACSRASLFLTRVLLALDSAHFDPIADLYTDLQKEWYRDLKSKVHVSIMTDWTSWILSTRKNA